ncbi:MAG: hypothetical protein FD174_155 [Geobacteraceae bacterium]|nr:MAG: hypothetical protein FD174_155 [Geobacteraceae bacterium]
MNKRLLIAAALLLIAGLVLHFVPFHQVVPLKRPFAEFPLQHNGWTGRDQLFTDVVLDKLKVTEYLSREYLRGGQRLSLYVGYYGAQREGAQIHSPKHCLPGGGWQKLSERTGTTQIAGYGPVKFVEALYQKGESRESFVYWYRMKNASITSDYGLKWYMILNSLRYQRNDAAFIRLSAPASGDAIGAFQTIESFMRDFLPLMNSFLPD